MNELTIGRLAKQAGVGVETVRFYERKGLIERPKKSAAGAFRRYSDTDPIRIRFIKRAQDLGFTLGEIKQLLELGKNQKSTCSEVKRRADSKIREIESKIRDLKRMLGSLKDLSAACDESAEALACCEVMDCFEPAGSNGEPAKCSLL